MARDYFDESKDKKKKKEKAATTTKSQSFSANKETKTTKNVDSKTQKSTFLSGGGSTSSYQKPKTVKKPASSSAEKERKLTQNTTAAQRQKMGMPTQQDLQSGKQRRQQLRTNVSNAVKQATSEENKGFMQRQKSGTQTEADKRRAEQMTQRRTEVARNTRDVAKKAVMDTVSGYGQSLADVDEMAKSNRNWTTAKAQKMGIDLNDRARVSKVEQERQQSIREAREFRQELFDKQEQRQAEWDERTKNAKGLEKAWYGAVESGTGMVADTLVGAATGTGQFGALASMGLRTYGPSTMQARKEGATDKEARLYGLASSAKEIGTELMFQGAGLAKAAYGKTGLSLADKSANILTKGLTGIKADAVGAGVRALGGTAEENVEELAGWMADPLIKELTYGKAVRNRMKENLRANIPQIGSDADAANVASYFSTPQFTDELTKEYTKSGMSKEKASELAAEMRDYYVAYYSGDNERLDALEEDLAAKLSGQDKLSLKSWSMDELKDTFASTTLLTLATGLPGAVTTSVKGNQIFDSDEVKAVFGADAVRKVADAVKNTSNKEMSLKAETMKDRLDSGKDLTGTQKYDLYQGYLEKVNETAKKARASYGVVENAREEQDLVPTMGRDRTGNTVYAKETQREYNEKFASTELTVEAIKNYMESDNSISDDESRRANAVKKAVADIHVGGLTVGDAHEFAYGNELAREALKAEEGIDLDQYIVRKSDGTVDLAATNEATENALFQINADNAIKAAQAETEVFIDDTRGNIDKDVLTRFGNNGQAVWKEVNKDLDPRNLQEYLTTANAAAYFYSAGRNTDMSVDSAINRYADTFKTVDNTVLKRAFAAGARDRIIANTPGYGQTVEAGSNISLKKTKPVITGQLIMDKDVVIPDSDQSAYLALAMSTNTNIHIVSSLKSKQGVEINGMSHGNDIYLNMNAAAESNLGYVFMHEMTHQIKQYAPNEYLALENLVRDRWFNKDASGMQKAIKDRIDLYLTKGGQQLTEEEAVEEIIADAMAEAMDDPDFAAQVCEEDINLGQAILNSIREALRSIRNMFASTEFKNDRFHNSLLSYLGILDEAEKMWLNALATAKQNKANGLIADWQDKANKQNSPRLSAYEASNETNETRFSLSGPVERVADLIAVHNLNEEDLVGDLSLGGFPMPSIAITKDSMGHDKYGSISLLFHSSTIDPSVTNANQVFGGDAYTPTFPRIHYKANSAVSKKLIDMYYKKSDEIGYETMRPMYEYAVTIDDTLDRAGGEKAVIERAKKDIGLKRLFLRLNDKDVEDVTKTTTTSLSDAEVARNDFWINELGKEAIQEARPAELRGRDAMYHFAEWRDERIEDLKKIYEKLCREVYGFDDDAIQTAMADEKAVKKEISSNIVAASNYLKKGRDTVKTEIDYDATWKLVDEAAKANNYDAWVDDLFKGIEEKSGIRNDKDLYTPAGNMRSWESLHEPVTLDNVVKQMKKELDSGGGTFLGNNPVGAAQKKYKSLDEIRADEDRLQYLDDENYGKLREVATAKLSKVSHEIYENSPKRQNSFAMFGAIDVGSDIAEALNKTRNKDKLKNILERDYSYNVSEQNMDDLMDALHDLANLPTGYFEAKPKRAVWFDEVKAAIVPKEFPDHLKAQLSNYGTNIYEYDPEVEGDRTQKINDAASENDLRFSISANLDEPYMAAVNSGNMDEAQRLVDEAAKMAGYTTKAYHGTTTNFNVFSRARWGENHDGYMEFGAGFYFTPSENEAKSWAERGRNGMVGNAKAQVMSVYLNADRVINADDPIPGGSKVLQTLGLGEADANFIANRTYRFINYLIEDKGFDNVEVQDELKYLGYDAVDATYGFGKKGQFVVFNPEQIKSADPVTYAEDDSVIPLSERFDPTNNDIRYSLPTQDSDGKILTDGQMEYFKNSQARDEQGRLVPVYHATDMGGFTIFDPMKSDDHRSLFFSDRRDVAKTYAYNGGNAFDFTPKGLNDWGDLIQYGRQLFSDADMSWDNDTDDNNLDFELYDKASGNFADIGYDEWLNLVENNDPHANDYRVKISLPYNNKDGETEYVSFRGDSAEDLLNKVSNGNIPHGGHYQVYLNLENPLIIDGQGQPWNDIVDGGSVFPAYSSITLRNRSWFEEEAEGRDEMYDRGQSLYNGDNARARAQEFEGDDYVEIEIFNGKKKIKAIIPLTEEAVAEEAAAAFGVDDLELLQGVASEIVGDMEFGNITKIYDDDMRNTIGEYGYNTREWAEFAEDEGYDGVIFRNIIDIDDKTEMFDSEEEAVSDIYVAFSSNQVKDINNENPTENPDIRYSITPEDEAKSQIAYDDAMDNSYELLAYYEQQLNVVNPETFDVTKAFREEDVVRFLDALKAEDSVPSDDPKFEEDRVRMAKSKEEFFNSVNARWNDRWITEGEVLKISSVKRAITNLVKGAMANSNSDAQYRNEVVKKTLVDARLAYQLMKQDRTELASYLLYHSAQRMMDGLEFIRDDTAFKEYQGIRDFLRTYRINAPEEFWENEPFMDFRKEYYGRLRIGKGNSNIEDVYQDLQDRWPHLFNEAEREKADLKSKPWDLLQHIGVVVDSNVTPFMEAYSSEEAASLATDLADQLYEIIANGDREVSLADSYKERFDAKTKAMKARHAEAIRRERKIREEGIKKERIKFREYKEAQKEKTLHTKYFTNIKSKYDELTKRLLTNTKEKHIPEQYKRELAELLKAFDFQTVGSKKREARTGYKAQNTIKLEAMRTALERIEANSQLFHINDSITEIMKDLLGLNEASMNKQSIEGKTLDELNASELRQIDKLLGFLIHEFNNYEKVKVGVKKAQAADIGHAQNDISLEHADAIGEGKDYQTPFLQSIDRIVNLDMMTPAFLFRKIDPNNEGLGLMWKEIRRSFDKYVRNTNQLNEWIEDIVGEYHDKGILWNKYGSGELSKWRSTNYAQKFDLTYGTLELTPAQMMSVACLANRKQAYDHMIGAGVVVTPVSFQAKIMSDVKKKINKSLSQKLTDADIKTIVAALTPEQRQVANKLQELMATKMADWGNEASVNVLGIKLFEDPDYFPIRSDKKGLTKDLDPNQFEQAIRNFGFTKAVQPGARNAIMIDDIFDVVTEHCNNMNLYNSYTEAMNDFMKVYNYREVREDGEYTVEQTLSHAFSEKAPMFIMQFIRDLNGNVSGRASGIESLYNALLANAKKASVFANFRVAAQQPTAISRAFYVIDEKYIKGIKVDKDAMTEMFEHCPIALWKSWGYYDINMGKSIEDVIMNNGRWIEDKATDLYGKLDNVTWTAIWQMVKAETKDLHPELKEGSDEFFEHCNERMSEIVDLTQVVDSPMHRSHAMRDKGFFKKMTTAFMAEPTLTFNMLRDGVTRTSEAYKRGKKKLASQILSRTIGVYLLQSVMVAGAQSLVDALRGKKPDKDDDDDRFLHLWWVNFVEDWKDEFNPLGKIYVVKDIKSMMDGWESRNLALQGVYYLSLGYRQLTGDPYARSSKSWYENMLYGLGYLTGVPAKTMLTGTSNAKRMLGVETPILDDYLEFLDSFAKAKQDDESDGNIFGNSIGELLRQSMDAAAEMMGYKPIEDKGELQLAKKKPKEGLLARMGIGKTEEEKEQDAFEKKTKDIADKYADLSGEEKDKKVWSSVTTYLKEQNEDKGVADMVTNGDYITINKYRQMYIEAGGGAEYFDERVLAESKKALKKSIKYDQTDAELESQERIKDYVLNHGMTEEELSDIVYHSETAKDLKVAFRLNDKDLMMESLEPLVNAGLTYSDLQRLWDNRNRMQLSSYKGRYKDKLKSTGKFIWPTDGVITSHFGYRNAPTAGASSNHPAIDIGAPQGTAVVAADGGIVISAGANGGYGNSVGIKHDNGMITWYNHLYSWNVKEGDTVAQGQQIAQVGSTGISTGPHLDFKIMNTDGEPVDPEKYLGK